MKMAVSCGATSVAGSWSGPILGWDNFADCWFVMSSYSPPIVPSSISPACGLPSGGIFETRSSLFFLQFGMDLRRPPLTIFKLGLVLEIKSYKDNILGRLFISFHFYTPVSIVD